MRLSVIMAGFARRFLDDVFPVFRSLLIHRFAANRKDFSLCHRDESLYSIFTIYIGAVKRHRISALLPESRTRKADALPGDFTSIIYVYNIFPYAYSMEIV